MTSISFSFPSETSIPLKKLATCKNDEAHCFFVCGGFVYIMIFSFSGEFLFFPMNFFLVRVSVNRWRTLTLTIQYIIILLSFFSSMISVFDLFVITVVFDSLLFFFRFVVLSLLLLFLFSHLLYYLIIVLFFKK